MAGISSSAATRRASCARSNSSMLHCAAIRASPTMALQRLVDPHARRVTVIFDVATPSAGFGDARRAALRALELDPKLPGGYMSLGHVVTQYDRDLEGGRRQYLEALKLQPEFARALSLMALNLTQAGDLAAASESIRKRRRSSQRTLGSWRCPDGSAISIARTRIPKEN